MAITANTVYVASYHTNVGHYSHDMNYFASTGVDSPPLHALADGVSGANGVYRLRLHEQLPQPGMEQLPTTGWTWCSAPAPPATLTSIAVTPANPTITTGGHAAVHRHRDLLRRQHAEP